MRTPCTLLSLSLALLGASIPAIAGTTIPGWRINNPFAESDGENTSIESDDRKIAMEANGYTLTSSTANGDGLTIEVWSPTPDPLGKRTPLLPDSLPGFKRDGPAPTSPAKRESLTPSQLRKRDSAPAFAVPEKRNDAIDIQGRTCSTSCAWQNWQKADTNDCVSAYLKLYNTQGIFTLSPGQALSAISDENKCSIWTVNHSSYTITYDFWDAGGTGQWLNGYCLIDQGATVGVCQYDGIGDSVTNGVYTAICDPSFMTGMGIH